MLTVVDEYTRQALATTVGRSLIPASVRKEFERLSLARGRPAVLRSDNAAESVAFEPTEWLEELGAATVHIEPGKLWENRQGESFNPPFARRRTHHMGVLEPAHARADRGSGIEHNREHVHCSRGHLTPDEFVARGTAAIEQDAA